MQTIDKYQDTLDVRDIIARFEELEKERNDIDADNAQDALIAWNADNGQELANLRALLESLCGTGGDEQWRGDWYPITMIRDSYFRNYAQELAEECGDVKDDARWPYTCIDWEKAARELRMDYTAVEFDDITYWVR